MSSKTPRRVVPTPIARPPRRITPIQISRPTRIDDLPPELLSSFPRKGLAKLAQTSKGMRSFVERTGGLANPQRQTRQRKARKRVKSLAEDKGQDPGSGTQEFEQVFPGVRVDKTTSMRGRNVVNKGQDPRPMFPMFGGLRRTKRVLTAHMDKKPIFSNKSVAQTLARKPTSKFVN